MVEAYPATALQSRHRPWLKLEKIAKPYVQGIGEFGSPCGSVALGPLIFWELVVKRRVSYFIILISMRTWIRIDNRLISMFYRLLLAEFRCVSKKYMSRRTQKYTDLKHQYDFITKPSQKGV
jgi:hypothetical protein